MKYRNLIEIIWMSQECLRLDADMKLTYMVLNLGLESLTLLWWRISINYLSLKKLSILKF